MPCVDSSSNDDYFDGGRARLDRLTRLLCEACRVIRKTKSEKLMSPELSAWSIQHQKDDAARRAPHPRKV
jgi:hypothetical protein